MLEQILIDDYCDPQYARDLARQVLESPTVAQSIANNETVLMFGAEAQAESPGATLPEMETFRAEFEKLREWISKRLGINLEFHPRLALPGFHLHFRSAVFGGKIHADGQAYTCASYLDAKFVAAYSVVLSLNAPSKGGGVHVWDKTPAELARSWGNLDNPPPKCDRTVALEPGKILLFNSKVIHQIEGFEINSIDESRVTLIAHIGEMESGEFYFFWDRVRNIHNFLNIEPKAERLTLDRFSGKLFPTKGS